MSAADEGARKFVLPSVKGRGFAMGHASDRVSLNLVIGDASFSFAAVTTAEARALAQAIMDAADFADAARGDAGKADGT